MNVTHEIDNKKDDDDDDKVVYIRHEELLLKRRVTATTIIQCKTRRVGYTCIRVDSNRRVRSADQLFVIDFNRARYNNRTEEFRRDRERYVERRGGEKKYIYIYNMYYIYVFTNVNCGPSDR